MGQPKTKVVPVKVERAVGAGGQQLRQGGRVGPLLLRGAARGQPLPPPLLMLLLLPLDG